ncbi:MAG: hypothetical protein MHM6MM_008272 [Cercozoa sp. M6MM]
MPSRCVDFRLSDESLFKGAFVPVFLSYRDAFVRRAVLAAVFAIGNTICLADWLHDGGQYNYQPAYLVYLTIWTAFFEMLLLIALAVASFIIHKNNDNVDAITPKWRRFLSLSFSVLLPWSIVVTLVFWLALFPFVRHTVWGVISTSLLHLLNSIVSVLDLNTFRHQLQASHVMFGLLYGIAYLITNAIYVAVEDVVVYFILPWDSALMSIGVGVGTALFYICCFTVLRYFARRRHAKLQQTDAQLP